MSELEIRGVLKLMLNNVGYNFKAQLELYQYSIYFIKQLL